MPALRGGSRYHVCLDMLIVGLSILSTLCWITLYHWYMLFEYYAMPGFSLGKVSSHFAFAQLQLTTLIFILISSIYIGIFWLIRRAPRLSRTIKLAIAFQVGSAGLINVFIYPVGAIDIFYYISELKLTYFYQQNPYLLTFLPTYANDPLVKVSAFLTCPLVYGPAWVVIAGLPTALVGFNDLISTLFAYKIWSLLFVILCGVYIYFYQTDEKSRWLSAYLFLANPLIMFEAVGNAHNDIIMTTFLIAAVLAMKLQSRLMIVLVLIAALTKSFALILLPLSFYTIYQRKWSRKKIITSTLLAFVVGCLIILPFWGRGAILSRTVDAIEIQQQMRTSSLVSLVLEYMQQRGSVQMLPIIRGIFACLFVLATLLITRTVHDIEQAMIYLLLLLYMLVSSMSPWYLIPVIALLTLKKDRSGLIYLFSASVLALISYPAGILLLNHGSSLFQMRLCLAVFLTLPIILFLHFKLSDGKHSRIAHI